MFTRKNPHVCIDTEATCRRQCIASVDWKYSNARLIVARRRQPISPITLIVCNLIELRRPL
ncbi:hypothetical protein WN48_00636 [Eufriesea mexicana]|uniref:Uncharacterized protein n=1 Tax=Eufriesea mexicana TaxID=516756 RepID=A0A310SCE9_9HYME|nr:hypothetical protein WN48_00636 [Eufriesea mexicana]